MEGPSLLILKEEMRLFRGEKVLQVSSNIQKDKDTLKGTTLVKIDTWGKVLFLTFKKAKQDPILTKTHFLMFGSYRINDPKTDRNSRLTLIFKHGRVDFYDCSIQFNVDAYFRSRDPRTDMMSKKWDKEHVVELLKQAKDNIYLCDLFLDQHIFTGSGNIVKNEVLFNIRRHPLTPIASIRKKDLPILVEAVHTYMWCFYKWKKKFELMRHWQVYAQEVCPLCKEKLFREGLGKFARRTFFCQNHQLILPRGSKLEVHKVLRMKRSRKSEKRLDH